MMAGRSPAELSGLLRQLRGSFGPPGGQPGDGFADGPAPRSRRRARRSAVVTYQLRVDLKGTKPPLWRRFELASDLFLDQMHDIIQLAFGWTDSHLHGFSSGPSFYDSEYERYLCPYEAGEGQSGVPEGDVRLDEVLAKRGDKLLYNYDFGDDWEHVVALEAVLPREPGSPVAACTGGRRNGPAEDCGGVYGYETIEAALNLGSRGHASAVRDFTRMFGADVDIAGLTGTPFDIDEINAALAAWSAGDASDAGSRDAGSGDSVSDGTAAGLPRPLRELVGAVRVAAERRQLLRFIEAAGLDDPVSIDAAAAARMVTPYTWLLDRVGDDGIKLTGAGFLPPAHVAAATAELGLGREWIGKGNRENQTMPVLALRETAQAMGLLRKHSGTLQLTRSGKTLRLDPAGLWYHLTERMPPGSKNAYEEQAGLLLLVLLAAGAAAGDRNATIVRMLSAAGWQLGDGEPLTDGSAAEASWQTNSVLRRVGAFVASERGWYGPEEAAADGVKFARAALQRWPGAVDPADRHLRR